MSTYDDDETSIEDSNPVHLFRFEFPTATYRMASGDHGVYFSDVAHHINLFEPLPVADGNAEELSVSDPSDRPLEITLPVTHPVAQRLLANALPPKSCLVTVWRYQQRSGQAKQRWRGNVSSIAPVKNTATIRVPPLTSDRMRVKLPTIGNGKLCVHALYDAGCKVPRNALTQATTTIAAISGNSIQVVSLLPPGTFDQWAQFGEIVHVATGERRDIYDQTGNVLALNVSIAEAAVGDSVIVYAGCDHDVTTCGTKFGNTVNFLGNPDLPLANPYDPSGFGVILP